MSDKIVESILNERDFLIKANDVFNYSFMTVKSYFFTSFVFGFYYLFDFIH
jgi:hypothetical protein